MSCRGRRRGTVAAGAARSARIRPSSTQETAKVTASTANGSHRVTPYSSAAEGCAEQARDVLAGLVLAEGGRQVLAGHDRADRRDLGRCEEPGGGTGEERDGQQVGEGEAPATPATASEA